MAKPEWGTKHVCQSCGTVYYDMKKSPPTCPKCGTKFDPEALLKSRRGRQMPDEVKAAPEEEEKDLAADELEALEDDDIEVEGDEEDDESLIEDASELGEGEDELVVEVDADTEDR